jgi:hypothetical protein
MVGELDREPRRRLLSSVLSTRSSGSCARPSSAIASMTLLGGSVIPSSRTRRARHDRSWVRGR